MKLKFAFFIILLYLTDYLFTAREFQLKYRRKPDAKQSKVQICLLKLKFYLHNLN